MRTKWLILLFPFLCACSDYFKNDYVNNSPTSGQLKVYYDEGLRLHVRNQVYSFETHYPNAKVELFETSESEAVQALFKDSCEAIIISRGLNVDEKKLFATRQYTPSSSVLAYSGVAVIVNASSPIRLLQMTDLISLLSDGSPLTDSLGQSFQPTVLFDRNNSAVLHYMLDSVIKGHKLSSVCSILESSIESINYVASHPNSMALLDYAWLSDVDDSLVKANKNKIRFLALAKPGQFQYEFPNQSSFKLNTYPLTRYVHYFRKTGEFTLAKGLESFLMGPKGQITFLKQGLMPARQLERNIKVNLAGPTEQIDQ